MSSSDDTTVPTQAAAIRPRTSLRYQLISAALACVSWGGWAVYINSVSESPQAASPVVSGMVQGIGSGMITLTMVKLVTWLYRVFVDYRWHLILPALCITFTTGTLMTLAHLYAGTADVVGTVAPPIVVAFCFNTITASRLHAQMKAHSSSTEEVRLAEES